jgi:flagellar assembly protein FliH
VLRDVVFQHQPHALLRPTQRLAAVPAPATPATSAATHDCERQAAPLKPHEPSYEDGLKAGYERGQAAGHAAAAQEALQAQRETLQEDRQHALDEGLRQGYQKGLEQAAAQGQQAMQEALDEACSVQKERAQRLEGMLAALPQQLQLRLDAAEDDMLALCHEVICSMLGQLMATPEAIRSMLQQLRGQLRVQGQIAVHLHPDDWSLTGTMQALPGIEWVADAQVELGGLLLRSPQGSIDARLEVQLQNLRAVLLANRSQRREAQQPLPGASS